MRLLICLMLCLQASNLAFAQDDTVKIVDRRNVCMNNNALFPTPQRPLKIKDRTYYVCCDECMLKMRRDPRVSVSIQDPENPYRYLEIRGKVVEITQSGADDHINKLTQKYLGKPEYPFRQPGEVRVVYKIEPQKVSSMG